MESIGPTRGGRRVISDRPAVEATTGETAKVVSLFFFFLEHFGSVMRLIRMTIAELTAKLPIDLEQLPDDVATLKAIIVELVASLSLEKRDKQALQHRLDLLLQRLYKSRNERFDSSQLLLFVQEVINATAATPLEAEAVDAETNKPRRCRPHGRRRLPDNLPREVRHHELSEAERRCAGCGCQRLDIGVDKSEQLEYRPASLRVIEHVVHKYVCPCCSRRGGNEGAATESPAEAESMAAAASTVETMTSKPEPECPNTPLPAVEPSSPTVPPQPIPVVISAPRPLLPIAKGLPGPGLLAHLIVSKYVDHLPLYRLQRIYERQGLFLPRSTLCDWLAACADLLQPLYARMMQIVLQSRVLHTDDTIVKMQELKTHLLITARLWVYVGDAAHPYNVFDFTRTRQRDGPQRFLADYRGYLQADAFSGYDGLYLPDAATATARIVEVACNAHARRKFYEARGSDALRAHRALAYYRQLYELESSASRNSFDETQRLRMRQELALPILERFRLWLESERADVLPKSPLGEAIAYALRNWTALLRYTEAGFLAIDNNVSEREMKRIAIGRKNWLFVGSPKGGATASVLFSFTSTCQRLGVEPWSYLEDILARLPATAADDIDALLPDRWQALRKSSSASASGDETASPSVQVSEPLE